MLPFNPQPIEELIARFPRALGTLYQQDKCEAGIQVPPGTLPEHIFDTADGLRMVASREDWDGQPTIHLSFAPMPGFEKDFNHSFRLIVAATALSVAFLGELDDAHEVELTNKALHLWFQRI